MICRSDDQNFGEYQFFGPNDLPKFWPLNTKILANELPNFWRMKDQFFGE